MVAVKSRFSRFTASNISDQMTARHRAKHTHAKSGAKKRTIVRARAKAWPRAASRRVVKRAAKAKVVVKKREKVNVSIPEKGLAESAIEQLLLNEEAVEYLKKNVSKRAVDVVNMLAAPKTDEHLAEQLGMKINAIRRILNIMHGYGITNYYVSKNTNGWLSFSWYVNANKVRPFLDYIDGMSRERAAVDENSNDYFVCNGCYKGDKFVYTFDAAFEAGFRCNSCRGSLERLDRSEVEALLNTKGEGSEGTAALAGNE